MVWLPVSEFEGQFLSSQSILETILLLCWHDTWAVFMEKFCIYCTQTLQFLFIMKMVVIGGGLLSKLNVGTKLLNFVCKLLFFDQVD